MQKQHPKDDEKLHVKITQFQTELQEKFIENKFTSTISLETLKMNKVYLKNSPPIITLDKLLSIFPSETLACKSRFPFKISDSYRS